MGGKAVKGARRYAAQEFEQATSNILSKLRAGFSNRRIDLIPSIKKQDFGDADILFESNALPSDWMEIVVSLLNPTEIVHNGSVWSLNVNSLQTDLILSPSSEYDFSYHYFSYNDVGNLVGRVAHKAGFKFGHKGLFKCLRDGDYLHSEVLMTRDFAQALRFLGYDSALYFAGFKDLTQIFEYVISGPYFDPYSYDLGNMSHVARVRDKKRPTYKSFLEWLSQKGLVGTSPKATRSKEQWLDLALEEFSEFKSAWALAINSLEKRQTIKRKYNGQLVSSLTGLSGKELGNFMHSIRLTVTDLDKFVLEASEQQIERMVLDHYGSKLRGSSGLDAPSIEK